jgi:hypothetical protein
VEADAVAHKLGSGDCAGALTQAQRLQADANSPQVPTRLRAQLRASTAYLAARIHCVPQASTKSDEKPGKGKHKSQKKHGKHGEGDD